METAVDGPLVIVPARVTLVPQEAPVETGHQLNAIEEVHAGDTGRAAFQQHEPLLERKERLVDAERARVGLVTAERIGTAMVVVVVKFHIARTQTHQRRCPRHELAERKVGAGIRQVLPEVLASHAAAAFAIGHVTVAVAVVALAHMREHVLKIHAPAGIELAVAVIESETDSQFRQERGILQIAPGNSPQQRQVRQHLVVQIQVEQDAVLLETADVVVAVGHEELEVPPERETEEVWRTRVERILVLVEERIHRRAVLHLGADILAQHVQVRKRKPEHQAVAVRLLARRRRNPAEDFLEAVSQCTAITGNRHFREQVQVLQAEFLGLEILGGERLAHLVQEFAFHHAGFRVLKALERNRGNHRTVGTTGHSRTGKGGRRRQQNSKTSYFYKIFHDFTK